MSIRFRITLLTGLLLVCVSLVVLIYALRAQRALLYAESQKKVGLALSMLSEMVASPLTQADLLTLAETADRAAAGQPGRVMVADRRGLVLVDSRHEHYDKTLPIIRQAQRSGRRQIVRTGETWQGAVPVRDYVGRLSGVAYVEFSARPTDEAYASVTRSVVLFAVFLSVLGTAIAYFLGTYFGRALSPLLGAIRRAATGHFGTRVPRTGMSELDEIGRAFDRMSRIVGNQVQGLRALNQLTPDLMAATTLEQFADVLQRACRVLVGGSSSLLAGDPRTGSINLIGSEHPARHVTPNGAAFLAVNEGRVVLIGEGAEMAPGSQVAERFSLSSGIVAPMITLERTVAGVLVVEYRAGERPFPTRREEEILRAIANLAAPVMAALVRSSEQKKAADALAEILLPEEVPQPEGLEVYAYYEPAEVASGLGGDYYDVFHITGSLWGIAIGDVSGKGLDAGRYTAMTKYVVRSFALEHVSPADTVQHADAALATQMGESRFVTLFYGILDLEQHTLTYCCAGHPPGLLFSPAADTVRRLSVGGGVVGCPDCVDTPGFTEETISVQSGDTLVLCTDGVEEARHDHEEYGLDGLERVVRANSRRSLRNIAASITDDVRRFSQNVLRDDLTLLLIRFRAT